MGRADSGDKEAAKFLRILTPLLKFRACRDNIPVATGAMEVRGGIGYIEEWVNARLVRDAHIGSLWEGTSNINALDIVSAPSARAAPTVHSPPRSASFSMKRRQFLPHFATACARHCSARSTSPSVSPPNRRWRRMHVERRAAFTTSPARC